MPVTARRNVLASPPPTPLHAAPPSAAAPGQYDDDALDRLADLLVDRLAARLGGLMPERVEPLVDAGEIARLFGRTRSWVYEHAGELGAVRLGSGPRPRLGFSPARGGATCGGARAPTPVTMPQLAQPRRARRRRADRTASGAELLRVRGNDSH
jgi:hypothetical protein